MAQLQPQDPQGQPQGQSQGQSQVPPVAQAPTSPVPIAATEPPRRGHKACLNCRKRKIKCVFDADAPVNGPCRRCIRERTVCEIPRISRRGGIRNVLAGREKQRRTELAQLERTPAVSALRKELYSVNDALSILTQVARGKDGSDANVELHKNKRRRESATGASTSPSDGDLDPTDESAVTTNAADLAPPQSDRTPSEAPELIPAEIPIGESAIVRHGLVTEDEALGLIGFFFMYMGPSLPFIPREYENPRRLANEPLLLAVIACLSARYYVAPAHLNTTLGTARSREVHKALWDYCLEQTSQVWWSVSNENVRSTIYALILLTEWSPIAQSPDGVTTAAEAASYTDVLRRYSRLCWLLVGQAVRLAQDSGHFETDMLMYNALHQVDHVLSCRLGRPPMLHLITTQEMPPKVAEQSTLASRARLDVIKTLHLTYTSLYPTREETRTLVDSGHYIHIQTMLEPRFEIWETKYKEIIDRARDFQWEARSVLFEFNHCRLYAFSLGLSSHTGQLPLRSLQHLHEGSRFLKMAIESARYIIDYIGNPINLTPMRCGPIRWMVRLMHATVFLAKILLFPTFHSLSATQPELIDYIRRATEIMDRAVPEDRLELSQGYARLLRQFCDKLERASGPHQSTAPEPATTAASTHTSTTNTPAITVSRQKLTASISPRSSMSQSATPRTPHTPLIPQSSSNSPHIYSMQPPPAVMRSSSEPSPLDQQLGSYESPLEATQVEAPLTQDGDLLSSEAAWLYSTMDVGGQMHQQQQQQLQQQQQQLNAINNDPRMVRTDMSPYMNLAQSIPRDGFGYLDDPDLGARLMNI